MDVAEGLSSVQQHKEIVDQLSVWKMLPPSAPSHCVWMLTLQVLLAHVGILEMVGLNRANVFQQIWSWKIPVESRTANLKFHRRNWTKQPQKTTGGENEYVFDIFWP